MKYVIEGVLFSSVGRAGVPCAEAVVDLGLSPGLGALCCMSLLLSLILFHVLSCSINEGDKKAK